jgi:hypothetical protein
MNSMFEAKGDKEGNLVEAAVETLASIARQLQWDPYFGLLMRSFRFLASKPDHVPSWMPFTSLRQVLGRAMVMQ